MQLTPPHPIPPAPRPQGRDPHCTFTQRDALSQGGTEGPGQHSTCRPRPPKPAGGPPLCLQRREVSVWLKVPDSHRPPPVQLGRGAPPPTRPPPATDPHWHASPKRETEPPPGGRAGSPSRHPDLAAGACREGSGEVGGPPSPPLPVPYTPERPPAHRGDRGLHFHPGSGAQPTQGPPRRREGRIEGHCFGGGGLAPIC